MFPFRENGLLLASFVLLLIIGTISGELFSDPNDGIHNWPDAMTDRLLADDSDETGYQHRALLKGAGLATDYNNNNEDDDMSSLLDNVHLSPFGNGDELFEERLSPPVNEPPPSERLEDDAELSGKLRGELADSVNRTRVMMQLLGEQAKEENEEERSRQLFKYLYMLQQHEPHHQSGLSTETNELDETTPVARYGASEYIDHPLALVGHQYVQGGAGEGRQLLGPDGTFENEQVVKSDSAVPSYCDPPNPCPLGYSAKDGCLENFANSASFSREYQAKQKCSCDNEHSLFNCASPPVASTNSPQNQQIDQVASQQAGDVVDDAKLDTLARTLQNRFGGLESVSEMIIKHQLQMDNKDLDDDNLLIRSARKWSKPLNSNSAFEHKKQQLDD